jgi:hypothetical protein
LTRPNADTVKVRQFEMDPTQNVPLRKLERAELPPIELGLSSVIIAAIGLLLFILPILAIPLSLAGLVLGIAGIIAAVAGGQSRLRLCVAGVTLAIVGLIIGWAIARAPSGYFAPRAVFPSIQPLHDRPYVPPPASPRSRLWGR